MVSRQKGKNNVSNHKISTFCNGIIQATVIYIVPACCDECVITRDIISVLVTISELGQPL